MTPDPTEMYVTMADIRAAQQRYKAYCLSGVREWTAHNGLEYRRLIRGQVSVAELEAYNDALARQLASVARTRIAKEQQNG